MKIKEGFILREVASNYIVVAVGKASLDFRGIINLNKTGAFLWKNILSNTNEEELINKLLDEYDVNYETAKKDVHDFINKLIEANIIE